MGNNIPKSMYIKALVVSQQTWVKQVQCIVNISVSISKIQNTVSSIHNTW